MQQNQQPDAVYLWVDQKLDCLTPSGKCCIFRVYNELRQVNEKAYEPDIIAIGPYHHGKENLMMMEEHKLRYLSHLLGKNRAEKLDMCLLALRELEQEARRCYAEPFSLNEDEWVKMMLLDGCFIIELVRKFSNDTLSESGWILKSLQRDLLLFENQLPLLVLFKLFDMIEGPKNHTQFVNSIVDFFYSILPGHQLRKNIEGDSHIKSKHLLGVVYDNWISSFSKMACDGDASCPKMEYNSVKFMHCVTELREAGIKFKKGNEINLFDIEFKDGVLKIPLLGIEDRTESFLRNLIAYEQRCKGCDDRLVSDYVNLFDCLVKSPNDIRVLCRSGIIGNWLGDDGEVSSMFNKLAKSIEGPGKQFYYKGAVDKINVYYGKRRNRWMAKLRRNYLNSPWAIISVLAATVLLVLTFLQTIYTMKSK